MGGGALMTPILVIFFGINPSTAVSSDLVAAMIMKPVGGGVHIRRGTVRWGSGEVALRRFDPHGLRRRVHPARERQQRGRREPDQDLAGIDPPARGERHGAQGLAAGEAQRTAAFGRPGDPCRGGCSHQDPHRPDDPHRGGGGPAGRADVGGLGLDHHHLSDAALPGAARRRTRRHRPGAGRPARDLRRARPHHRRGLRDGADGFDHPRRGAGGLRGRPTLLEGSAMV